jgi:Icc-related predicted phosphoesterase
MTKQLQELVKLPPDILSQPDNNGQTLLHWLAQAHNLDFLFAMICVGCDQRLIDKRGHVYLDYLDRWERDYLRRKYEGWKIGKVWLNVYRDYYDRFLYHGYSTNGEPAVILIWKHQLGLDLLEKVLEAGIDLDQPAIKDAQPPLNYAMLLASYGWTPSNQDIFQTVKTKSAQFYQPRLWTLTQLAETITVRPVEKGPTDLFGKTIVCISDTHWEHRKLHIPGGEFLICSGDICMPWIKNLEDFLLWMGEQTHTHKILVAGNHDKLLLADKDRYLRICREQRIHYLEDSDITIEGIKFWGSPWTPKRPRSKNNAFTANRRELMKKWDLIPSDTNILITHCPPYAIGDCNTEYYKGPPYQGGDYGLRRTINRLSDLKLHLFGHQHFGRGIYRGSNNTYFANSAIVQHAQAFVFT